MKKNRSVKKIIILLIIIILGISFQETVMAFSLGDITGNTLGTLQVKTTANKVVEIVSTIGSILSVIVIIVLGIKYMVGSVEERADYKKTMLPFLIGAIFIFAASSIASIVYHIAINI